MDQSIEGLKKRIYEIEHNSTPVEDHVFDILVPSDHGKIGISVKPTSAATLLVMKVLEAGFIPEWNATNSNHRVEPGDVIANINGVTGDKAMIREMRKGKDFTV